MAFGFIKKVFSFGRKDVEERPAEDALLPPVNFEALKPEEQAIPEFLKRDELLVETTTSTTTNIDVPPRPPSSDLASLDHLLPVGEKSEPDSQAPNAEQQNVDAQTSSDQAVSKMGADGEAAASSPQRGEGGSRSEPGEGTKREELPAVEERKSAPALEASEADAAPHPPAGTFSPYGDGEKEKAPASKPVVPESILAGIVPESVPAPLPPPPLAKVTVAKKVEPKAAPVAPAPPAPRTTWFQRLREGLARSSKELSGNIAGVFTKRKLDEETLQELEDVLIRADLGLETALRVTDALSASRYGRDVSDADVRAIMAVEIEKVLTPVAVPLELDLSHKPHVILVVGVNGTGKTTTIGKLAAKLTSGGLSVMLAAGDTFRAAAIEQLKIWGERTNSPVIASKLGADASGLAWDAFEKAKEAGSDVLIIDTAGRLQNRAELMAELEKIVRVLGKHDPEAPHTVLQTVDATTGQNALNQVEIFRNVAGVSGLVMTKLDGTARGGILVAIAAKHKLPVYFIGVGEQVDDLEPFSASEFARAIAGVG